MDRHQSPADESPHEQAGPVPGSRWLDEQETNLVTNFYARIRLDPKYWRTEGWRMLPSADPRWIDAVFIYEPGRLVALCIKNWHPALIEAGVLWWRPLPENPVAVAFELAGERPPVLQ